MSSLVLLIGSALALAAAAPPHRPHILVILVDDMGWSDVGFHGSTEIPTPNIDALAFNGLILNRHYVQPTCTPTRAALMTGRYPMAVGMQGGPIDIAEPTGVPLKLKLLPQFLKDLGYRTHAVGKWHLGYYRTPLLPLNRGFQTHFGPYGGYIGYYDHLAQARDETGKVYDGLDFRFNGKPAPEYKGQYATDLFTERTLELISNHNESEPLFLYLAHTGPHGSHPDMRVEAPRRPDPTLDHILNPQRRIYAQMVKKIDDGVGEVVELLGKKGMLENTMILFFSDNGAPSLNGLFPNYGSNYPLRGAKETLWEGGVRSPTFLWSANFQKGPKVLNELVHVTDWLPTFFQAAGGVVSSLPPDLDGVSHWDSFTKGARPPRESALLDINEKKGTAALVARLKLPWSNRPHLWKIITGQTEEAKYNQTVGTSWTAHNTSYDVGAVLNSRTSKALKKMSQLTVNKGLVMKLRVEGTVDCPTGTPGLPLGCKETPCLFNVDTDPCERLDFAQKLPGILHLLKKLLKAQLPHLSPQRKQPSDLISANPAKFNNTWSTWVNN